MQDKELIAWFAGLYEGEGCLYLGWRKNPTKSNRVGEPIYHWDITSTDKDVLDKAQAIIGYGKVINVGKTQRHYKNRYRFRLNSAHEIYKVMKLIYSWLCDRRKQKADEFIKFYEVTDIQQRLKYEEDQKCKGCGQKIQGQRGRGYCKSCYCHWYRHGDPLKGSRRETISKDVYKDRPMVLKYDKDHKCVSCGNLTVAGKRTRGMCQACDMQWRRKSKYKFVKK